MALFNYFGSTTVKQLLNKLKNQLSSYLKSSELAAAIDTALAEAKASGEFDGKDGDDGISPTVATSKSGKVTTITITDKTGNKTATINDGADGRTPQKNVDYFTEADKAEWSTYIASELAKRGQLAPEYAESVEWLEANGDQSKMYVLPDGMIWAWMLTEKEIESGPSYTNALDGVTKNLNQRWSHSSKGLSSANGYMTVTIPVTTDQRVYVNLPRNAFLGNYARIHYLDADNNYVSARDAVAGNCKNISTDDDGITSWVTGYEMSVSNDVSSDARLANADNITQMVIVFNIHGVKTGSTTGTFNAITEDDVANVIVSIGNPIVEGGGTTIVTEYAWASTGHAFVPADYEPRIIKLEKQVEQNTADIKTLKKGAVDTGGKDALTWIRQWDAPIYDKTPVWEIKNEKAAITSSDKTVAAVYAKYDALMAANPDFITKTDLGLCSDGATHVYRYDFCEREPRHQSGFEWSETKPKFIVVTGIHREWNGIYGMFHALSEITTNSELAELRRSVHFIVVPVLNPYSISGDYSVVGHAANYNGVEIHRNFEVGFSVSGADTIHYTGETPLSEVESQYLDNILKNNTDAAYFLTCHSFDRDKTWGVGFLWGSSATKYMCNMAFRVIDKMGKAWHKKYGATWEQGIANANSGYTSLDAGDYRIGHAALTNTGGCEQRQATKYGIQATNFETCETFFVLDSTSLSAKAITHGAEAYVNFFLTAMGCYDFKDKKQYYVG